MSVTMTFFTGMKCSLCILIFSGLLLSCSYEEPDSANDLSVDDKRGHYEVMDYGPVLAESIRMKWPENSLVRKGLSIRLDHDAAMIFDTDLIRVAGGTVGGWLDISQTDYTGYKGSEIASVEGRQVFGSTEIAGWAKEGDFYGLREDGMGPLPRDWARYEGYYRYGDQVVLSYSVGETDVLELPETLMYDESVVFTRTIRIGASDHLMQALIAEQQEDLSTESMGDRGVIFESGTGNGSVVAGLAHAHGDVKLVVNERRIELHIPPSDRPRTLQVFMIEKNSQDQYLFEEIVAKLEKTNLKDLTEMIQGGPSAWDEEITLSGIPSDKDSGYVTDRLPIPFDNPWGSWMRLSGLDFFEDGHRAAVSTWNGDVWIVSGIDDDLEHVTWRRFASGLFYPMGVAIVEEQIYVTERSQLTRLHDLNGNGEADYYESFNNDGIVYPMAHTLGLEVDSEGNFYFFKNGNRAPTEIPQHGALVRVSSDGMTRDLFSNGSRGANTLGIGPDDTILSADQQGNWVPVERIDVMKRDGFYGFRQHGGEEWQIGDFEPPVAWIPYEINNSSGSMTFANDTRWGPLSGHWLLGSYGQASLLMVLIQQMGDNKFQGGVVELPVESQSGLVRARMNPGDGQLYMVGLRGWTTLGVDDGSFERVRYAGGNVYLPLNLQIAPYGIEIEFTEQLNRSSASNVNNYTLERWEYIYSGQYGSPEVSFENPEVEGRDPVALDAVSVSEDGRSVFLEIPDMRSVMQMKMAYDLTFEDGRKATNAIYFTVNWLTTSDARNKPGWQQRIITRNRESAEDIDLAEETGDLFGEETVPTWFGRGESIFQSNCASCHSRGGVAPPMSESEWAAGSYEALMRILLQGKRGNRGVMTPFSWMSNEEIASVVSYIRFKWHEKTPISASEVDQIRQHTQNRTDLWTDEELKNF